MENLIAVIYAPEHVPKRDPLIMQNEFKSLNYSGRTVGYNWRKFHNIMHIKERDYLDKRIAFYDNGKFYQYSSMIPE